MLPRPALLILLAVLSSSIAAPAAEAKDKNKGKAKGSAVVVAPHGTPPGLAKKGGLPPGLAKRLGRPVPARIYVAFDPRRDDRAWFLIDDRWVLYGDFDPVLRLEVRHSLALPHIPLPPMPPPLPGLHVVIFG